MDVEKLKIRLIKEMRQESSHLIKFAKDMGFVATEKQEGQPKNNNFIFVGSQTQRNAAGKSEVDISPEKAKQIENMDPMERERLRHKLEDMLVEAEKSEIEAEFIEDKDESKSNK
jgi:hypothetical protein